MSWGGTYFTEVQELAWDYGGKRTGRDVAWTAEAGSATVTCLGTSNTSVANFGLRGQLVVSGGGAGLSAYAIWESVAVTTERNGVTRYTVSFRLLDN